MIRRTMHNVAKRLEHLLNYDISLSRSFDLLESRARTIEEMIVIEVMRESYREMKNEQMGTVIHSETSSRSARMPSMAFRR